MYILPGQSRETEKLRGEQEEQETSQNRRIWRRRQKQVSFFFPMTISSIYLLFRMLGDGNSFKNFVSTEFNHHLKRLGRQFRIR